MGAVRARLGAELRTRWRSTAALVLVVGVIGGLVLATLAGARRTDTAYRRFLESSHAEHVSISGDVSDEALPLFRQLERLPQVAAATRVAAMVVLGEGLDTPYHPAGADVGYGTSVGRANLIAGRLPDAGRADEVLVNRAAARRLDLRVGSHIEANAFNGVDLDVEGENARAVPVRLEVVGIGVFPGDVVATTAYDTLPILYPTNAYYRAHPDLRQEFAFWLFRLQGGERDIPAFRTAAERVLAEGGIPSEDVLFADQSERTAKVERAIRPQGVALLGFALLTALVGVLLVGQTMARQLAVDGAEYPVLRSIGMTPRQLVTMALARAGIVATAGALLAVVAAIAVSPRMPIGPARLAEPDRGVEVNVAVLAAGAAGIVAVLLLRAARPAWRAARVRSGVLGTAELAGGRPSRLSEGAARASLPIPAVVGVRMALEPGRGRTAVPVRSAVLGTALAIAAVAGAFTFNTNLDRLVSTPELYGWTWDVAAGIGFFPMLEDVRADVIADPAVAGLAGAEYNEVVVADKTVPAVGITQLHGVPVFPTLLEGRRPRAPDEIVLGSSVLRRAHRGVGDTVTVGINGEPRAMRVVGRAVFPKLGGAIFSQTGLGEGAATLAGVFGAEDPANPYTLALMRFAPGVDRAAAQARVARIVSDGRFVGCPSALCITTADTQRPGDIENYARVRGTPLVLAALLVAMAVGALGHTLVSSIRRRRRDVALLKTLGFYRRQVSATTAWQATTMAVVSLLVGLPLGVAVGRLVWVAFAHALGVPDAVRTPALVILLAVPVTLLLANVIAAIPALSAARTRPAVVLRTE